MNSSLKRKRVDRIVTRSWSKKQKIDEQQPEPDPKSSIPVTKQKITKFSDLNAYCQIEIFRYCSIDDLVSVVKYDKKLIAAARWVFKQKTQHRFVCISNKVNLERCNVATAHVKVLNHFGGDIDGLILNYDNDYHRFDHIIEKAMRNRCHKTLKSLRIENVGRYSLFGIKKPFKNVRQLQFSGGTLNYLIPQIDKWFPNVSKLRISNFMFPNKNWKKLTLNHCHALRDIQIRSNSVVESNYAEWVTEFVILNPQLTKLSVTFQAQLMAMLSARMPILSNLHLEIIPSQMNYNTSVHFEKLKKLSFRGHVSRINVTANEIGTLDINLQWLINDDLRNLIQRGSSINRLNIINKWHFDSKPNKIIKRIKDITNLKELTFTADDTISTKEIINLIGGCKTLKWIFIHADKEMAEYPGIKEELAAKWMVHRRKAMVNNVLKFGFEFRKI